MINETWSDFTYSLPPLTKDFRWNSASTDKNAIWIGKLGWGKMVVEGSHDHIKEKHGNSFDGDNSDLIVIFGEYLLLVGHL